MSDRAECCQWCSTPVAAPCAFYFYPSDGATSPALACEDPEHRDAALGYAHDETDYPQMITEEWEPPEGYVPLAERRPGEHKPMCSFEWCTCGEFTDHRGGFFAHQRSTEKGAAGVSGYSLNDAVKHVLDTSDATSPEDIAELVAADVPHREWREVLAQALGPYVRAAIAHRRQGNPILAGAVHGGAGRTQSARSPKVTGIREEARQKALRDRLSVGDDRHKFLGDCTFEDLMFAAGERRTQARRNEAKAAQYEALALLLQERGVSTVAELPDSDLDEWETAA